MFDSDGRVQRTSRDGMDGCRKFSGRNSTQLWISAPGGRQADGVMAGAIIAVGEISSEKRVNSVNDEAGSKEWKGGR